MVLLRLVFLLFLTFGGGAFACLYSQDLTLSIADSPDPVECSEQVTYTLVVENRGLNSKSLLTLNFYALDRDFNFIEAVSSDGWSCFYDASRNKVTCSKSSMAPGEKNVIKITFKPGGERSRYASVYAVLSYFSGCGCGMVEACESTRVTCTLCSDFEVNLTGNPPQKVGEEFDLLLNIKRTSKNCTSGVSVAFDVYWSSGLSLTSFRPSSDSLNCRAYSDHLHCCVESDSWEELNLLLRFKALSGGKGFVEVRNFGVGRSCSEVAPCFEVLTRFNINLPEETIIILDPWGFIPNPFEEFIRVVGEPRTIEY